jgi:hypothetical protein
MTDYSETSSETCIQDRPHQVVRFSAETHLHSMYRYDVHDRSKESPQSSKDSKEKRGGIIL